MFEGWLAVVLIVACVCIGDLYLRLRDSNREIKGLKSTVAGLYAQVFPSPINCRCTIKPMVDNEEEPPDE